MRYPKTLKLGDTIGICATSSGVTGVFEKRLEHAVSKLTELGYVVKETASVRQNSKLVSNTAEVRVKEFMDLYLDDEVKMIIPPWGGELLMEILPLLDYQLIETSTPKWVVGFSDTSALLFTLTTKCDIATVHGPNALDFAGRPVDPSVLELLNCLHQESFEQQSLTLYQKDWGDVSKNVTVPYQLSEPVKWKSLHSDTSVEFEGRLIGGCTDIICKLIGTPFAQVQELIKQYTSDGFIWYFESCDMNATDLYRTFWQMDMNGWFKNCQGILIGRVEGYSDSQDFNYNDVLSRSFKHLDIPVLYDVDIGHIPPQLTLINGARGKVSYSNHKGSIIQTLR